MDILTELLARNARAEHHELPLLPRLGTLIVTCPDPRVDPAHIFGLQPGDAAVIRAAGGRISPIVLQNMLFLSTIGASYGQPASGAEVILMPHTDCGLARLASLEHRNTIASFLGMQPDEIDTATLADPRAAVRRDLETLAANPLIPDAIAVTATVYNVSSGRVELIDRRAPLR